MADDAQRETDPRLIIVGERDNVASAAVDLPAAASVMIRGRAVTIAQPIPSGHKVALATIDAGQKVIKYDAVIGTATRAIAAGEHVHLHNLRSDYLPPTGRDGHTRQG